MRNDTLSSKVRLKDFDPSVGLDRGASKFKEVAWYFVKMLFFLTAFPFPSSLKRNLLRVFGSDVGSGVIIKPRVNIHMPWKLSIGNHVWIGEEAFLLNFEQLIIHDNVCVSQRAFLCGGNHDYSSAQMLYRNGPIVLEEGAWVGANCFVAPNVTIGKGTVVTACSVVTKSLDENGIYSGNPLVYIKPRWK
jgi:putative colanic acid biosynthesis acetyltransferase WcaF